EEHREGSGHEELYVVLRGRARFTLDGEELDASAGTLVFLPDSGVLRVATAEDEGTTVLAVGGWPDRAFEPSAWEWGFEAYGRIEGGDAEGALAVMHEWLDAHPDDARALYNLACIECRTDRKQEAVPHLRRALQLEPELREEAREDPDLESI